MRRLCTLGHRLGLLRRTASGVVITTGSSNLLFNCFCTPCHGYYLFSHPSTCFLSVAGSGNSRTGPRSRVTPLSVLWGTPHRILLTECSSLHRLENPKPSLPGCSLCCRMTLEHQILIKRGIKRASFHYTCHRTDPRKALPSCLACFLHPFGDVMPDVSHNGMFPYAFTAGHFSLDTGKTMSKTS